MILSVWTRAPGLTGSVAVGRNAEATTSMEGLNLVAEVSLRVELRGFDHGAKNCLDVAIGREPGVRHAIDEGRRRIVGDKTLG
jgi:hypothetical protein